MLPIDETTRDVVRASFAPLLAARERFASAFYARLFEAAPNLRALFPEDLAPQRRKFVDMLVVVIDAGIGGPAVRLLEELGARHVAYGARPEHYPVVHDVLLATLRTEGAGFDDEAERAWRALLRQIAGAMLRGAARAADATTPLVLLVRQPTSDARWIVHDDAGGVLSEHETRAAAEAAAIHLAEAAARRGRVANLLFHHEDGTTARFKIG